MNMEGNITQYLLLLLGMLHSMFGNSITIFPSGPNNAILTCTLSPIAWTFTQDGSSPAGLPSNVQNGGSNTLTIISPNADNEGLYTCLDMNQNTISTTDVTVLGLAKFAGCSSQSDCDQGLSYNLVEMQPLIVNISIDFYNGGDRDEKQDMNFIFIDNPNGDRIVSCKQSTSFPMCVDAEGDGEISTLIKEEYFFKLNISNRMVEDSGVYTVIGEVYTTLAALTSFTSYFSVTIVATTTTTITDPTTTTTSSQSIPGTSSSPYLVITTMTSSPAVPSVTTTSPPSSSFSTSNSIPTTTSFSLTSSKMSRIRVTTATTTTSGTSFSSLPSSSTIATISLAINDIEHSTEPALDNGYIALIAVSGLFVIGIFIVAIVFVLFRKLRRQDGKYNAESTATYVLSSVVQKSNGNEEKVITTKCEIPLQDSFSRKTPEQHRHHDSHIEESTYCEISHSVMQCGSNGEGVYSFTTLKAGSLPQEPNSKKVLI